MAAEGRTGRPLSEWWNRTAGERPAILARSLEDDERRQQPRPRPVERFPEPDEKPHRHAQWDEVRGVWMIWRESSGAWVDIPTTSTDS